MTQVSCNCVICAEEFNENELLSLSKDKLSRFKICQACLNMADPSDDYRQVRNIIKDFLNITGNNLYAETKEILVSIKK